MVLMEARAPLRKITLCGGCETASSLGLLKPFEQSELRIQYQASA